MHDCTEFEAQLTAAFIDDCEPLAVALSEARLCARCGPLLRDLATAVAARESELEPSVAIATRAVTRGRRWAIALYSLAKLVSLVISLAIVIAWLALVELRDIRILDLGLGAHTRETVVTLMVAGIGYLALVGSRGRRLYSRWSHRQLQGICTGIAEHFGLPLWLVRIAFIGLFFAGLGGGTIYFLLAFLVDFHPDDRQHLTWFRIVRWWRSRGATAQVVRG